MFIKRLTLPTPTPASVLRRIARLEAAIAVAEPYANLRRERLAYEKKWRENQAIREKEQAAHAAQVEADRARAAESLLQKRPYLKILIEEGRPALVQRLQSETKDAGESGEKDPLTAESRADALLDTLLRAKHDIHLRGLSGPAACRLPLDRGSGGLPSGPAACRLPLDRGSGAFRPIPTLRCPHSGAVTHPAAVPRGSIFSIISSRSFRPSKTPGRAISSCRQPPRKTPPLLGVGGPPPNRRQKHRPHQARLPH